MPASSTTQQHIMGMVHAFQKGALKLTNLPATLVGKVKKIAKSISPKAAKEFASTKTKGLPKHVKESEEINLSNISFKQYMQLVEAFSECTPEEMEQLNEMYGCSDEEMCGSSNEEMRGYGYSDEEPEVSVAVTRDAVQRGEKEVRFDKDDYGTLGSEEEEPSVSVAVTRDAVARGEKEVRFDKDDYGTLGSEDEEATVPENMFSQIKSKIANKLLGDHGHRYMDFAQRVLKSRDKTQLFKAFDDEEMDIGYVTKHLKPKHYEWLHAKEEALKKAGKGVREGVRIDELWKSPYKTPKSKKGMFSGKTVKDLESEKSRLKKSGPHKKGSKEYTRQKEVGFALRAKGGWSK